MMKYLIILLIVFLLIGCQQSSPEIEPIAGDESEIQSSPTGAVVSERGPVIVLEEVSILGKNGFDPEELRVAEGSQVIFTNTDNKNMIVTFQHADTRKFSNSDLIKPTESYTHDFDEVGVYSYWAVAYGVKGRIIVE